MDSNKMYEQEAEETLAVASRIGRVTPPADMAARIMARLRREDIGLKPIWLRLIGAAAAVLLLFNVYTLSTRTNSSEQESWSSSEIISNEYQIMSSDMDYGGEL